jgi:hypothetical protein
MHDIFTGSQRTSSENSLKSSTCVIFTGIHNGLTFCLIRNSNAVFARSSFTAFY